MTEIYVLKLGCFVLVEKDGKEYMNKVVRWWFFYYVADSEYLLWPDVLLRDFEVDFALWKRISGEYTFDLIQVFFLGISHLANAEDRCVRKCRCVKIACKRIATSALFYAIQTKHYF